jgi:flagellar biosynthetic protein FliS
MMMAGAARYTKTQTQTASKERILLLLLNAARKQMFLADGELGMERPMKAADHVRKAIDIVAELRVTLDHTKAPDLCRHLDDVYGFVLARLHIVLRGDRAALNDARKVFTPIVEAFEQALGAPK